MSGGTSLIDRLVATSIRFPLIVLLLAVALTAAALIYTARHFAMTADTAQLISTKLAWRQRELAFQEAFPQLDNLTMVVVDGVTPELADDAGHPHWQFDALDSLPDREVGERADERLLPSTG